MVGLGLMGLIVVILMLSATRRITTAIAMRFITLDQKTRPFKPRLVVRSTSREETQRAIESAFEDGYEFKGSSGRYRWIKSDPGDPTEHYGEGRRTRSWIDSNRAYENRTKGGPTPEVAVDLYFERPGMVTPNRAAATAEKHFWLGFIALMFVVVLVIGTLILILAGAALGLGGI